METMKRDLYEILGIGRNDDPSAIKAAYRKLALKYHPDRNPGDREAEEKFKEITRAYEVLCDPEKRRMYDLTGSVGGAGGGSDAYSGFGIDEALRAFQEFFGFGHSAGSAAAVGKDVVMTVSLELREVVTGGTRELEVSRLEPCDDCAGTGADPESGMKTCSRCDGHGKVITLHRTFFGTMRSVGTCSVCKGTGRVPVKPCPRCSGEGLEIRKRRIFLDIPAGVSEGHFIRLRGQGHHPPGGGRPGDLVLKIEKIDYGRFRRDGFDLLYRVPLSFPQAALGTKIKIPPVEDGEIEVELPPGVQPGEKLVLKRKGIAKLKGFGRGDLVLIADVYIPRKLSRKEKNLLGELDKSGHFTPPGK